ncbi:MAG TPA: methylenetetrahydrofolate reductase [NAD(P)H] [Verrucomicrobiota bacterium]|nr:methylenetetrahydrofolate reductase [NAD(P)H] [Verrucomicrobiota bacterium]HNT13484.1 methylenetetrahydrofolate reductase [NAD(P)H] [Verrucomicrobiota bacterium]
MRWIRDIYAANRPAGRPVISLEFFPPKTPEGEVALFARHVPALATLKPDFCSVTYGAGGSTRDKTLQIVTRLQQEHQLTTLAHLTCVNHTREQLEELLEKIRATGCQNILALRGDPPGGGEFKATPGGFEFSSELISFIRAQGGFSIGCAGFPEGHIACRAGKHTDWRHLKTKVDAGADFVITQLFFDNNDYLEFRDHLTRLGVAVPLIPGMIAITNVAGIRRFAQACGAKIPSTLAAELERLGDDDAAAAEFGIEYCTKQCEELLRAGVPGLHFYTLNKAAATLQVARNLGLA